MVLPTPPELLLFSLFALNAIEACLCHVIPTDTVSKLRIAIDVTKRSAANITAARQACEMWDDLMSPSSPDLPSGVRGICLVLQGSCLVRTGQDDRAVIQYSRALKLRDSISTENLEEAILGRGRSLQRLMKYADARDQFLESLSETSTCAAATCSLRLGEEKRASQILQSLCDIVGMSKSGEAAAMLGTIKLLENQHENLLKSNLMMENVAKSSLLYRWILYVSKKRYEFDRHVFFGAELDHNFSYLDLANANISPFDEPNLAYLDDKVLLHKLLTRPNVEGLSSKFWPEGAIIPVEKDELLPTIAPDNAWICKRRAGYGSHGNQVLNSQQAKDMLETLQEEECLLQRMVHPPLLLDGRKFSLRIYVVHFGGVGASSTPEAYISTEGLVKLAFMPLYNMSQANQSATSNFVADLRIHMTNSGRERAMEQYSLEKLKEVFEENNWCFEDFWESMIGAVRTVITIYHENFKSDSPYLARLAELGIPKIMGFDFVLDAALSPWLVEVNRFPGLEPREEADRVIKHKLLKDSWVLASQRMQFGREDIIAVFGKLLEEGELATAESSLVRVL